MEPPSSWNRATAALYFGLRVGEDEAWELLVSEGWARPERRAAFDDALALWAERAPRPGPSRAAFVADHLRAAGALRRGASWRDPHGKRARRSVERLWGPQA